MHLLLATSNIAKLEEMRAILFDPRITFHTLGEFTRLAPVNETGRSYEENSAIKAISYAQRAGLWALADDSGLEVEALDHAPGVFSARYAGPGASDSARIAFLLSQLKGSGSNDRAARFVCVTALAEPNGSLVKVASGSCQGQIIETPRGASGFGYDPIFVPSGFSQTFAQLTAQVKNAISHRAKSLEAMNAFLKELLTGVHE
jgi:XTP/dITP diphosphohydrolase